MLQVGERVPDVHVQRAPGEELLLPELLRGAPALLLFYLFDWSST
jgi:peroxiredoxin